MNFLIILVITIIAVAIVFQIRRENIKNDLKIVLISFVIIAAIAVSASVAWKKKPVQQSSPNISNPTAINESQFQPASQVNQHNQAPYSSGGIQPAVQNPIIPSESGSSIPQSQTALVKTLLPSVVMIKTPSGSGSGFFIDRNGSIVTNHHVLCGESTANIILDNGQIYTIMKVVAEDSQADLLIVHAEIPPSEAHPLRLSPILPEIAENILAIGSPRGYQNSVTNGIVSAIRREGSINLVQVSAPISKGNSGGPVVNMRGDVIGVATKGYNPTYAQNLSFCVSSQHITGLSRGSGYPLSQMGPCREQQRRQTQVKDVYCALDAYNKVNFVEFPTDTKISRPDGSLDRMKFEQWVFEKIGGSPALINPAKEAQEYIEQHRDEIFKISFPYKSSSDRTITLEEQQFLHNNIKKVYADIYNRAVAKKNDAVSRYRDMMHAFDMFARQRSS